MHAWRQQSIWQALRRRICRSDQRREDREQDQQDSDGEAPAAQAAGAKELAHWRWLLHEIISEPRMNTFCCASIRSAVTRPSKKTSPLKRRATKSSSIIAGAAWDRRWRLPNP